VLATVYRLPGKSLICLARWPDEIEGDLVTELTVDWAALGLDPDRVVLRAPAVQGVQEAAEFAPGEALPIAPAGGWWLIAEER
jgi:hypothetical protein